MHFYTRCVKLPGCGGWAWPCGAAAGFWGAGVVARGRRAPRAAVVKIPAGIFTNLGGQNDGFGCKHIIFTRKNNIFTTKTVILASGLVKLPTGIFTRAARGRQPPWPPRNHHKTQRPHHKAIPRPRAPGVLQTGCKTSVFQPLQKTMCKLRTAQPAVKAIRVGGRLWHTSGAFRAIFRSIACSFLTTLLDSSVAAQPRRSEGRM